VAAVEDYLIFTSGQQPLEEYSSFVALPLTRWPP
jgi:hypothetical protein